MRAAVLKANGLIAIEDRPVPPLGEGECRVRVEACGICSSDIARGLLGGAYSYPLVMGHEVAGTVEAKGPGAPADIEAGDLVTVFPLLPCFVCSPCQAARYVQCQGYDYFGSRRDGGYTEFLNIPGWNVLPLPSGVSALDGALTEPTAVVLRALDRLDATGRDPAARVGILGGGFLGLMAACILRQVNPGARIVLADRNEAKVLRAEALGIEARLLPKAAELAAFAAEEAGTFDAVLEAAGAPATFSVALQIAAPGGKVVWMGNISGDLTIPKEQVSSVLRKELDIAGTWNSSYRGREPSDWTKALELMASGFLPSRFVNRVVGLEELLPTLQELGDHKAGRARSDIVKAVVLPGKAGVEQKEALA